MFVEEPREEILKIDMEPMNIQVTSEPYIICNNFGYVPVIDVWVKKRKRAFTIYLSASSLGKGIETIRKQNGCEFIGLEVWIRKEGAAKTAKYLVTE